ncbi:trypsin-like serine protease, partial [Nocardioides sp. SOB44]
MKQVIVILATLGLVFAAPSIDLQNDFDINQLEQNGTYPYHPTIGGRIVGGVVASIQDLPWQVALLRNGAQICGGIIIAPQIVLTAAHCVVPSVISAVSQLNIRSGSNLHNSG